jgi:hypothetical protein
MASHATVLRLAHQAIGGKHDILCAFVSPCTETEGQHVFLKGFGLTRRRNIKEMFDT